MSQTLSRLLLPFLFILAIGTARCGEPGLRVAVTTSEICFTWPGSGEGPIEIREIPLHTAADPQRDGRSVWKGDASAGRASIPRLEGGRDRLHAKFTLGGESAPQHVTDFTAVQRRSHGLGSLKSKKGLTCVLGIADAVALGCSQVNENIDLGALLDWQSPEPKLSFEFEGRKFGLHPPAVARLDAHLLAAHAAGMRVTGILLYYVRAQTPRESPLLHPLTDPATVTAGPSAFNTATAEGLLTYRALVHWLIERYTREDAAHGWLAGLVIGNEVQSHWTWYHLGLADQEIVIREYTAALRAADLVARSLHTDFPIYASLEHHWTLPASDDPQKGCTAVEVLEGLNARAKREGDFPWHLAYHPYPENLGNPRFWADRSAPLRFDAPRLTFHNLEVLPAFLRQPHFLFEGKPRRIALTEQGFHCPEKPDGEAMQAAAFALAWKKVQALPTIESFLYHRHVDHPHEGGLRCGVREHDGSKNVNGVGRARKIWEVMQKAGTAEEEDAFAFALPIVGRGDWKEVVATRFEPPRASKREPGRILFDFLLHHAKAQRDNVQAVELRRLGPPDEVQERALLEQPKASGRGRLTWRVRIPDDAAGRSLLTFDALLDNAKSRGAGFIVEIEGREIFNRKLAGGERVPATLDLAEWRGREVTIAFAVEALADPAYDWALWIAPRVVQR